MMGVDMMHRGHSLLGLVRRPRCMPGKWMERGMISGMWSRMRG